MSVINGSAGTVPGYSYISPATGISYEYELCFKCHSSWTTQPGGQPDMSVLFNPSNPSYHPVEALGQNSSIDSGSFVNGWLPGDTMHCTDCHTSDNNQVRGPHGSQYEYILGKDYDTSSSQRPMISSELCFDCHNYDTYITGIGGDDAYSRFPDHRIHTETNQLPCYNCHDSHASTSLPHLVITGGTPGMTSYTENAGGGSCDSTATGCHTVTKNYSVQYAR